MLIFEDFTLGVANAQCPACAAIFSTPVVLKVCPISPDTAIETDLHRVYSSSLLRAARMGMCNACGYAWWLRAFHILSPTLAQAQVCPPEQALKKFGNALVTGRQQKVNHLELALIALNAAWCARDGALPSAHWLALATEELSAALKNPSSRLDRGFYHFLAGELLRLAGDFRGSVQHFQKSAAGRRLPENLIIRQTVQALAADASHTRLPEYLVEALFCPRPCAA